MAARLVFLRGPHTHTRARALSHKCAKWKNRDAQHGWKVGSHRGNGQGSVRISICLEYTPAAGGGWREKLKAATFFSLLFLYIRAQLGVFAAAHTHSHTHTYTHKIRRQVWPSFGMSTSVFYCSNGEIFSAYFELLGQIFEIHDMMLWILTYCWSIQNCF